MTNQEELINQMIQNESVDSNNISDGYHTFKELYDHRIALFMWACKLDTEANIEYGSSVSVWRSKAHSDGSVWDGWFILGIFDKPGEQITYHLPISYWDKCAFAEDLDKAPDWDGHTSDDVLKRILAMI